MEYTDYCSACLITGVKMYRSTTVDFKLLQFLRFPLSSSRELKASICYECAALLQKFEYFRRKCDRAYEVLSDLRQTNHELTKANIQNVDRQQHKLVSTITLNFLYCVAADFIHTNITDIKHEILSDCEENPLESNNTDADEIKNELKYVQDSPLHDYDDQNDLNNDITENIQDNVHKKLKTTDKKEHKRKKRKASTKDISTSESISDDEPLANKKSKINDLEDDEVKRTKRKNCILKYFEDYATVVFLGPEEAKKELLLRKESRNYMKSPFKCKYCYRGFDFVATFDNHMKKHSKENGSYECEICHLWFPKQRCLCKHRLAAHKRKFSCKLCPYVCYCTNQAKTHISLHKGKTYSCNVCGDTFSLPNSMFMHKRMKHVTECVCELCGNTFATERGLRSHHLKLHRQDKIEKRGPTCEECGIHFATEDAWKLHLVLSTKHNVSNGCKYCGKTFPNSVELKIHLRVHSRKYQTGRDTPKLPTSCALCGKYLGKLRDYKAHMRAAHPLSDITSNMEPEELAAFVCETCGLAFKKECYMKYHQRTHTGERPYKCVECGKGFKHSSALSAHAAAHARRAHVCGQCGRAFSYKSGLNKHMKVHLNIRPHRCHICDKSFISPCDVKIHIKYVHNNVPWPKRDRTKKAQ